MKTLDYLPVRTDYYKNSDFPAVNGGGLGEEPVVHPHGEVNGKPVEKDPVNQEQEQQMEAWMTNIKAFIRSIDISKL